MSQPRVDARLQEAVARLRNNADFQLLLKYQQAVLDHTKTLLVTCTPDDVSRMQGRAQQLQDDLNLLSGK